MVQQHSGAGPTRRAMLGIGATLAAPYIISARGEVPVKIGQTEELTGAGSVLGQPEVMGSKYAVAEINRNGGVLGRQVVLLTEDSAADTGTGVTKALKLIDRDQVDVLLGDPNSGIAYAQSQVANQKGILVIFPGAHTDPLTGAACKWNVFRICNTTGMDAAAITKTLVEKIGKRWYFITPDYAYGHTLQAAFEKNLARLGGTWAGEYLPQDALDFSAALIKARLYKPDVLLNNMYGLPQVDCMKQFVQFGMNKQMALGGALFELEDVIAVPAAAQTGWWDFEWWWDQPGVPHVAQFTAGIRKAYNRMPSARIWFGYVGMHAIRLAAEKAKSLESVKLAHALEGLALPPEIALQPGDVFFRAGDHQLISTIFVGQVHPPRGGEYNVFTVAQQVPGAQAAGPVTETGCRLTYPS
jgi:branched-chain amino acid transport system substrate-binding protein